MRFLAFFRLRFIRYLRWSYKNGMEPEMGFILFPSARFFSVGLFLFESELPEQLIGL